MTDLVHTTDSTDPQGSAPNAVRSLESLLDDATTTVPTLRLSYPAADAVVVARRDREVDVVLDTGFPHTVAVSDTAEVIDDPVRQVELYRRAVRSLEAQMVQAQQDREQDAERHRQVLRDIRAYAIEKQRNGDICQRGLNDFLRHFDMATDDVLVRYTITGSYRVKQTDPDTAESDGRDHLDVDFSQVDDVVHESVTVDVRIDGAESVDDD
jgi:hypothetical protein